MLNLSVKSPKSNRDIAFEFDNKNNLEEMSAAFTPEVVFSLASRMLATDIGNKARAMLNNEETPVETVMAYIESYVPGVRATAGPKKVTAKQAEAALPSMSADELKALLESARAALEAQEG